jgi:hypothetical protein
LNVESLKSHDTAQIVPIVRGAVMIVRREAYSQVGSMDDAPEFLARRLIGTGDFIKRAGSGPH